MTTIINGSSPSITFSDSTTQTTAFNGQALSASPYTTSLGSGALVSNTGVNNTAVGYQAGYSNVTGTSITAVGYQALYSDTVGINTAVGYQAGKATTSGGTITAVGYQAGLSLVDGDLTAVGYQAGKACTTPNFNVAVGNTALLTNTTGANNTALGSQSLRSNTTASNNTAVGYQAGYSNLTGVYSCYVGAGAGYSTTGSFNTFVGCGNGYGNGGAGNAVTTGAKNTIIGSYSGNQGGLDIRTASNYIVLSDGDGNPRMWFNGSGNPYLNNVGSGAGTNALKYNTSSGIVTYDTSSARYKDNIRDSKYGLTDVLKMRSTQFEYKDDGRSDVGLIAEELQPIIPELVGLNKDGQADSVSYDRMVSVLVKAIQELKAEFDAYKATHP